MPTAFTVKGTTGDVTACDCCHRRYLLRTVALVPLDDDGAEGDPVFYGTGCAAAALGVSSYEVRRAARAADIRARIRARAELRNTARRALVDIAAARARLVDRIGTGRATDTTAGATAARLGLAVGRHAPERRGSVEAQARRAFADGGFPALLAVVDHHAAHTARLARLDPVEI